MRKLCVVLSLLLVSAAAAQDHLSEWPLTTQELSRLVLLQQKTDSLQARMDSFDEAWKRARSVAFDGDVAALRAEAADVGSAVRSGHQVPAATEITWDLKTATVRAKK